MEGYKDSPLGEIPSDWEVDKLGKRTTSFAGGTPKRGVNEYYGGSIPWIKSGEVNNNSIEGSEEHVTELAIKESSTKLIEANSILVALYGATAGKVGVLKVNACSNQAVLAITTKDTTLTNQFLYHYLKKCTTELLNLCQGSGQPNLSKGIVDSVHIPLPPLPEQQKIAEILSTVDAKIEVIDQQITETQELKKGLMQRLLTKGIGHAEFKDSPLGEIPKSWEVVRLAKIAKCTVGIASSATHAYTDKGILLIRNQNIKEGRLDLSDALYVTEEYELKHKAKRLKSGDILTVRTGYPGISAVVPKELEGMQSFTTLIIRRKNDNLSSEFLCYYINSDIGKSFFNSNKAGGGQKNVGSKTLESMKIPLLKKEEQSKIVEVLEAVDEKLECQKKKKISYQELKKGLMQQLLTGKTRVNGLLNKTVKA